MRIIRVQFELLKLLKFLNPLKHESVKEIIKRLSPFNQLCLSFTDIQYREVGQNEWRFHHQRVRATVANHNSILVSQLPGIVMIQHITLNSGETYHIKVFG